MRSVVVFQSPVTRLFTDSYFGGVWGQELRSAGYDGMLITGAAAAPVYLEINNKQVAIKPAAHLWGLDTFDTYERLRPEYPDKEWRIVCIGPAGENRVKFAVIDCDWHRQAGRGGGGAVMGAKNLKAIVVRGTGRVPIADPEAFKETVKTTLGTMKDNSYIQGFRSGSTAASIPWADVEGLLPTRNFQRGQLPRRGRPGRRGAAGEVLGAQPGLRSLPHRMQQGDHDPGRRARGDEGRHPGIRERGHVGRQPGDRRYHRGGLPGPGMRHAGAGHDLGRRGAELCVRGGRARAAEDRCPVGRRRRPERAARRHRAPPGRRRPPRRGRAQCGGPVGRRRRQVCHPRQRAGAAGLGAAAACRAWAWRT